MLEAIFRPRRTSLVVLCLAVLVVTGCAHPWFQFRRKTKRAHPPSPFVEREVDEDFTTDPDESSLRGGKS